MKLLRLSEPPVLFCHKETFPHLLQVPVSHTSQSRRASPICDSFRAGIMNSNLLNSPITWGPKPGQFEGYNNSLAVLLGSPVLGLGLLLHQCMITRWPGVKIQILPTYISALPTKNYILAPLKRWFFFKKTLLTTYGIRSLILAFSIWTSGNHTRQFQLFKSI